MPAAGGGGDDGCGKHQRASFRCLDAARYTVAAVVTVLIVTVSVIAVKLMLRPESLRLSVVGGVVYSTPRPAAAVAEKAVTLSLNLRTENPSGRARMYLLNATAYLFDNETQVTTRTPDADSFIYFTIDDEVVRQQLAVDAWKIVDANEDYTDPAHLDTIVGGGVIADATLRVDGTVITEVRSGVNRTRLATYLCRPLLVGAKQGGGDASNDDVLCTEKNLASQDQSAA